METEFKVEVGFVYERRDGLKAFVYKHDPILDVYCCLVVGTGDFFSVYENGKYSSLGDEDRNDLISKVS